jgi:hypothetical protein
MTQGKIGPGFGSRQPVDVPSFYVRGLEATI